MADENLLDLQRVQCIIPPGSNGTRITITHNLQDTDGNPIAPDSVVVEVVSYPEESPDNPCNLVGMNRIPSSPEDGTYELEIRAADANAGQEDWDIVVQVTSMWEHSIQSDDHIPELTIQAGTPITDCPVGPPLELWGAGSVPYSSDTGSSWADIFVQPLPAPYNNPGDEDDFESFGIMSPAAGTVWTCGTYLTENAFAAYWDGAAWTIWDNSTDPFFQSAQYAIHGFSANDAWMVGIGLGPICAQWAGGPNWIDHSAGCGLNDGHAVWAASSSDVWIGGKKDVPNNAAVSHWNGASWVPAGASLPNGISAYCQDIWAADGSNIWAVGGTQLGTGFIWFYNGASWSDITPAEVTDDMWAVYGLDASNVWAVGNSGIVMYWNGVSWTQIIDAVFSGQDLSGVFAYAADNIWMTAYATQKIFHWDGATWTDVAHGVVSPNANAWNYITGVWY